MIPAQAVEAAAEAVYLVRLNNIVVPLNREECQAVAKRDALAAIEAAAPYTRPYVHYVAPTDSMWDEHQRTVDPACTCDYEKIQNGPWRTIAIRRGTDPNCAVHK